MWGVWGGAGELSPELEGLFAQVMKSARAFTLPIRLVKAAQRWEPP
jgi:hypothetical protein